MANNYYEELGLDRDASPEEIKKSYRKLARKYHPDISQAPDAEKKMQAINTAYDTLSDPLKKQEYDQQLDQLNSQSPFSDTENHTNHEFSGFEDLFGRFGTGFGGGYAQRSHQYKSQPLRGEDQHASIEVPLQVAFEGVTQSIQLRIPTFNAYGQPEVQRKTLEIRIPKGMKNGQQIRLKGQGQAGLSGGENGDLYIQIHYQTTDSIYVDQADIYYHINISPWEAALGQDIELKTPSGKIKVSIPQHTIYGKQLRIKEKGIPSSPPGHLYLILNIVYPKAESPQQKQAYEQFAQAFTHFNPRDEGGES